MGRRRGRRRRRWRGGKGAWAMGASSEKVGTWEGASREGGDMGGVEGGAGRGRGGHRGLGGGGEGGGEGARVAGSARRVAAWLRCGGGGGRLGGGDGGGQGPRVTRDEGATRAATALRRRGDDDTTSTQYDTTSTRYDYKTRPLPHLHLPHLPTVTTTPPITTRPPPPLPYHRTVTTATTLHTIMSPQTSTSSLRPPPPPPPFALAGIQCCIALWMTNFILLCMHAKKS